MKNKKLINSFKYAFIGIWSCYKSERNMKIHIAVTILVILFGIFLKISIHEWITCIVCFAMVIGAEMFNTAIETVVDIAMPKKDERAKKAKDVAAGGVLVFAIGSAIIGSIIFMPKIIDYLNLTIK
jgi:diacylglycerol kinase